jgi:hypothetical protein
MIVGISQAHRNLGRSSDISSVQTARVKPKCLPSWFYFADPVIHTKGRSLHSGIQQWFFDIGDSWFHGGQTPRSTMVPGIEIPRGLTLDGPSSSDCLTWGSWFPRWANFGDGHGSGDRDSKRVDFGQAFHEDWHVCLSGPCFHYMIIVFFQVSIWLHVSYLITMLMSCPFPYR